MVSAEWRRVRSSAGGSCIVLAMCERRRGGDAGSRARVVVEGKQTTNGDENTRARATQHDRSVVEVVVSRPTAALEPSKEKSRQGSDMDLVKFSVLAALASGLAGWADTATQQRERWRDGEDAGEDQARGR